MRSGIVVEGLSTVHDKPSVNWFVFEVPWSRFGDDLVQGRFPWGLEDEYKKHGFARLASYSCHAIEEGASWRVETDRPGRRGDVAYVVVRAADKLRGYVSFFADSVMSVGCLADSVDGRSLLSQAVQGVRVMECPSAQTALALGLAMDGAVLNNLGGTEEILLLDAFRHSITLARALPKSDLPGSGPKSQNVSNGDIGKKNVQLDHSQDANVPLPTPSGEDPPVTVPESEWAQELDAEIGSDTIDEDDDPWCLTSDPDDLFDPLASGEILIESDTTIPMNRTIVCQADVEGLDRVWLRILDGKPSELGQQILPLMETTYYCERGSSFVEVKIDIDASSRVTLRVAEVESMQAGQDYRKLVKEIDLSHETILTLAGEHWAAKGRFHVAQGKLWAGEQAFELAVECNPLDDDSWGNRARVLTALRRFSEAHFCARQAQDLCPDVELDRLAERCQRAVDEELRGLFRSRGAAPDGRSRRGSQRR